MSLPRFQAKNLFKLFNLGLHLNNEQNKVFSHPEKYGRLQFLATGPTGGSSKI